MACILAVVHSTKYCLLPSCSSHDFALDGIFLITQLTHMAAKIPETANNFATSINSIL